MKDGGRTKEQLINELLKLRKRIAELEAAEIEHEQVKDELQEGEERFRMLYEVEQELPRREQEFRVMAENVPGLFSYVGADGCYRFVNRQYREWFQLSDTEIIGKHYREILGEDTCEAIKDHVEAVLSGRQVRYEAALPYKHGGTRWVIANCVPDIDQQGEVHGFFVLVTDITERKRVEEALRESEERYRMLADNSADVVYRLDENLQRTYVSPSVERLLGYTPDEHIKQSREEFYTPASLKLLQTTARERLEAIKSGVHKDNPIQLELEVIHRNGSTLWVETRTKPIFDDQSNFKGFIGITRDITERKRAQEALQESERRYRLLADNAADTIWTVDLNMRLTYASPSITRLLGYSVEEAKAKKMEEVFTPASFDLAMKVLAEELAIEETGEGNPSRSRILEFELKRKDGSMVPVEGQYTFLRDPEGQPVEVLAVVRDITERKRAEQALKESEEKFRNLAEQSPNMICIHREGKVIYANEKCEEIMGYPREEIYSADFNFWALIAPESIDAIKSSSATHMKGEEVAPFECTLLTEAGKRLETIVTTKLITYGKDKAVLAIVTDITERKGMEEALRAREEELELKAIELEDTNTALKVLLKHRDQDRAELEDRIMANVKDLILPSIERLKATHLDAKQMAHVRILESHINDFISPFPRKLSSPHYNLTFKEIQVASLVKQGRSTKEIAELLNISPRTAKFHRENVREKLGLRKKKINLKSHLFSIQ